MSKKEEEDSLALRYALIHQHIILISTLKRAKKESLQQQVTAMAIEEETEKQKWKRRQSV